MSSRVVPLDMRSHPPELELSTVLEDEMEAVEASQIGRSRPGSRQRPRKASKRYTPESPLDGVGLPLDGVEEERTGSAVPSGYTTNVMPFELDESTSLPTDGGTNGGSSEKQKKSDASLSGKRPARGGRSSVEDDAIIGDIIRGASMLGITEEKPSTEKSPRRLRPLSGGSRPKSGASSKRPRSRPSKSPRSLAPAIVVENDAGNTSGYEGGNGEKSVTESGAVTSDASELDGQDAPFKRPFPLPKNFATQAVSLKVPDAPKEFNPSRRRLSAPQISPNGSRDSQNPLTGKISDLGPRNSRRGSLSSVASAVGGGVGGGRASMRSRRNSVVSVADEGNRIKDGDASGFSKVMQSMKKLWSKPRSNAAQFFKGGAKQRRGSLASTAGGNSRTSRGSDDLDVPLEKLPSFMKKLFGDQINTKRLLVLEEASSFLIHPFSPFRQYWDMFMLFNLLFLVVTLPYRLSYGAIQSNFTVTASEGGTSCVFEFDGWNVWDSIQDFLFFVDIVFNFRTAFYADGVLVDDAKSVARHYAKTWFFIDLISTLPFDIVWQLVAVYGQNCGLDSDSDLDTIIQFTRVIRVFKLTRLIRFLRIVRLPRLFRIIQTFQEKLQIKSSVFRIFKLLFMMVLLAHLVSCAFFIAADLSDFPERSWVMVDDLLYAPPGEQYIVGLWMVFSHMLSIGYGVDAPREVYEVVLTMLSMLLGASFYALFIGNISSLLMALDASGALYQHKIGFTEEYMRDKNLPLPLRSRIRRYYRHRWKSRKAFEEKQILSDLSFSLRRDVQLFLCRDLIATVPFFQDCEAGLVQSIVSLLEPAYYLKHDMIVVEGEIAWHMFFIRLGEVEVFLHTDKKDISITRLSHGSYFGEIALLRETKRSASVKGVRNCELYLLASPDFKRIMDSYPEVKSAMERVADLRLEKLRALELQNKNVKRKHSMIVTIANFDAKQMRKIQEKTERYSVKKTQDGALAVPGIGEAGDGAKPSTASSGGGRMSKKGSKKKHLIRRISAANMEEDDEEDYQPMKEMLQPTIQRRKSDVYSFAKEEPLKYFSGEL
mmetsp:Transcript_11168/g.29378  ORF Transcript_11168/g.29378 Transcript_11168/m.29378 type:complete len:1050 (-) Transcript_11168:535-3684(-)